MKASKGRRCILALSSRTLCLLVGTPKQCELEAAQWPQRVTSPCQCSARFLHLTQPRIPCPGSGPVHNWDGSSQINVIKRISRRYVRGLSSTGSRFSQVGKEHTNHQRASFKGGNGTSEHLEAMSRRFLPSWGPSRFHQINLCVYKCLEGNWPNRKIVAGGA